MDKTKSLLALIQKRYERGDDAAAAEWIAKSPHGFKFSRTALRLFRIGERTSRHHADIFIEAYNAVQRNRQKRQSRIKSNEHTKQFT